MSRSYGGLRMALVWLAGVLVAGCSGGALDAETSFPKAERTKLVDRANEFPESKGKLEWHGKLLIMRVTGSPMDYPSIEPAFFDLPKEVQAQSLAEVRTLVLTYQPKNLQTGQTTGPLQVVVLDMEAEKSLGPLDVTDPTEIWSALRSRQAR